MWAVARGWTNPLSVSILRAMGDGNSQGHRLAASLCPSCERFIGPADVCPYCGTGSARTPVLRLLRAAALLLSFLGLAFLYLMSAHREIPLVAVADISPFMNFARVRVAGTVTRAPYVPRRDGAVDYLFFTLDDGSGLIRVAAQDRVARRLVEGGLLPGAGSSAEASGSLSVSAEGDPKLRLHRAEDLKVAGRTGLDGVLTKGKSGD